MVDFQHPVVDFEPPVVDFEPHVVDFEPLVVWSIVILLALFLLTSPFVTL